MVHSLLVSFLGSMFRLSNTNSKQLYNRILKLDLPKGQSAFIWGARGTGKSTFLKQQYPDAIYYDLLSTDDLTRFRLRPGLLRSELESLTEEELKQPVIIDEVQKIPELLDEVHWLIENKKINFILCGSSARKLKRGAANLLGGRAWKFTFYPLVYKEVNDFDLLKVLNQGLVPIHYTTTNIKRSFISYVDLYLKEEIQEEGLVRNLSGFARFLDLVGFSNTELLNYKKIATDCHIDAKTVKEYYQILLDTLLGYYVTPFNKQVKRQLISSTPKFYLFDVGIGTYLAKKQILALKGMDAGKAFEHYIFMELNAYIGLKEIDCKIQYWRSKTGLEVDFVLGDGKIAIEVKISENPSNRDFKGLNAFCDDYAPKKAIVVCLAPRKRLINNNILVLPWQIFLDDLWSGKILSDILL